MIKLQRFIVNLFEENTYVLYDTDSRKAMVVDAGMMTAREREAFDSFIADNNLHISALVNTHMHLDHSFGIKHVKERYGVGLTAQAADSPLAASMSEQGKRFGMRLEGAADDAVTIDNAVSGDSSFTWDGMRVELIPVPGHTPGGMAIYIPELKILFSGDSLFAGGIGRTDLPGGNHRELVEAIRSRLLTLPPDTTVLPGHMGPTTIAAEKNNPYLA